MPISSPCVRVCCVEPRTGWCEGCFRTLKEIVAWSRYSDEERAAITADLPRRQREAEARAAGAT